MAATSPTVGGLAGSAHRRETLRARRGVAPTFGTRAARRARLRPPLAPRGWGRAAVLTAQASVVAVVGLWVLHGGPAETAQGTGAAATSLGRLAGLVSSDLLLVQVLAMARIPWVERAVDSHRVTRWHRVLGVTSVLLLLVHAGLSVVGYALLDGTGVLAQLGALVARGPGMLLAVAGAALLVLVGVTSARSARRRLRYEAWHLLHLYAYLGAGLALPHQLWAGGTLRASDAASAYWLTLYGAALACTLAFRVVLPLARSWHQRLTVSHVVVEAPGVVSVHLTGPRLRRLRVAAGQWFVWRFRTGEGWTRGHPLSLSAAPSADGLRVTLDVSGDDGPRLATLAPGTRVLLEGPFGRLTPAVRTRPGLVALAAGLGITPVVALLQDAALDGSVSARPATLVRRSSTGTQQPLQADIDALAMSGLVRLVELAGPRSATGPSWLPETVVEQLRAPGRGPGAGQPGPAGRPTDPSGAEALRRLVPDLDDSDVYVCGPPAWVRAVVADLRAAGVAEEALHVETFAW